MPNESSREQETRSKEATARPPLLDDHLQDLADDVLDDDERGHADEVVAAVADGHEHDEDAEDVGSDRKHDHARVEGVQSDDVESGVFVARPQVARTGLELAEEGGAGVAVVLDFGQIHGF